LSEVSKLQSELANTSRRRQGKAGKLLVVPRRFHSKRAIRAILFGIARDHQKIPLEMPLKSWRGVAWMQIAW